MESNYIINKLLDGCVNWTPEELQYQQNFPDDIENILSLYDSVVSECIYRDGVLLVPTDCHLTLRSILSEQYAQKRKPVKRVLPKAHAVALALYADKKCDKTIAIMEFDSNSIVLSVLSIGGGVLEFEFLNCRKSAQNEYKETVCDICKYFFENNEDIGSVDECVVLSEMSLNSDIIKVLEQYFVLKPYCLSDIPSLYEKGMCIQKDILDNTCRYDVVVLDMSPYPITIEMGQKIIKQIVGRSTIPCCKEEMTYIPEQGFITVKEDNDIIVERIFLDNYLIGSKIFVYIDISHNGNVKIHTASL